MSRRVLPLVLFMLLCGNAALSGEVSPLKAPPPSAPVPASYAGDLEEIEVTGRSLRKLRQDVNVAEDRFYQLYNQLNTDHAFDIHCVYEAPTFSLIKRRVCKAAYVEAVERDQAVAFLNQVSNVAGPVDLPSDLSENNLRELSRRNMRVMVTGNPELLHLLLERHQLQKAFEKAHAERMNGRWIYID